MNPVPWDTMVMTVLLTFLAAGAWKWRTAVRDQGSPPVITESWQHVEQDFPMPTAMLQPSDTSREALEALVKADPFSQQRRQSASAAEAGQAPGSRPPVQKPAAQFVYKGRILMGTRQRAVVEDLTSKKTHFLEIGQEIEGFKVLDITETQVVLSKPNSQDSLVLSLTAKQP